MHIVWEAKLFDWDFLGTIGIGVIVILVALILSKKAHDVYKGLKFACAVMTVISAVFLFCPVISLSLYNDWNYAQKNQMIVEGPVEDLCAGHGADSFSETVCVLSLRR